MNRVVAQGGDRWLFFEKPLQILRTNRLEDVLPMLREAGNAVDAGRYAAGFLSYESAPAFDSHLCTRLPGAIPLLWFGIYDEPLIAPALPDCLGDISPSWTPDLSRETFAEKIGRIKQLIAAGDTYQVNFSFRLAATWKGNPWNYFCQLSRAQRGGIKTFVDTGDFAICSASPELFFRLEGDVITCRPMKGTAARGLTLSDDLQQAERLQTSEKNRAENIMITDMIRNDLGRVARPGSVETVSLFDVERYETLWQMTSTVRARTSADYVDIFRALFPCSSVTGAPKVRTTKIITELESSPRGIYTGAIGFIEPGRKAQFSVAIRTVQVDQAAARAEYGTGAGIVWDSEPEAEWEECLTKALVVQTENVPFQLLETMRWDPVAGFHLLERHLDRMSDSAAYFGFTFDRSAVITKLRTAAADFPGLAQRVRLLVDPAGVSRVENENFPEGPAVWRVTMAHERVQSGSRLLYHKTTRREIYERARAAHPGFDDVILCNERGEITESCLANVAVRRNGKLFTPPVRCGLLAGTLRAEMLAQGKLQEAVLREADLQTAEAIFLLNSVRGVIPADISRTNCD